MFSGEASATKSLLKKIFLISHFSKKPFTHQFWNKCILVLFINVVILNYKVKIIVSGKWKKIYYARELKAYTSNVRDSPLDDAFRALTFFSFPLE